MKRPSMQFYPGDWLRDPGVRASSKAAKGLWIDMLCLMHENAEERGLLPFNDQQLARMTGDTPAVTRKLLAELERNNVFSRTTEGVIFCRRMVRDEKIRRTRAACGVLGGNPRLTNNEPEGSVLVNQTVKQNPTPSALRAGARSSSSSSSSSPSGSFDRPPAPPPDELEQIRAWLAEYVPDWPKPDRAIAEQLWQALHGHSLEELADLLRGLHKQGRKPTKSWMWFVTLTEQHFGEAA